MSDLEKRFNHHSPKDANVGANITGVRAICLDAAERISALMPEAAGREKALMLTNLEQTMFWANAGIARNQ